MCGGCGDQMHRRPWKASTKVDWGHGDSHPHLCENCRTAGLQDCRTRALEAVRKVERAQRERQEAEAAQASKAGRWLGRWRG